MLLSKLKLLTVATMSICLLGGVGVLIYANAPARPNQAKLDAVQVQGFWVAVDENGVEMQRRAVAQVKVDDDLDGLWVAVSDDDQHSPVKAVKRADVIEVQGFPLNVDTAVKSQKK